MLLFSVKFNFLFAQGEASLPFLLTPVSPVHISMGLTGTSIPMDDPYGFLFNPAQLGFTGRTNNLSLVFYPFEINWRNLNLVDINGIALNAGYNFKKLIGFPLSVGFGFANPEIKYKTSVNARDYYYAYSIGAGIDYYLQFYAGVSIKAITSVFSKDGKDIGKIDANAVDYGFMLNVPVLKLIDDEFAFNLTRNIPDKPYVNFSVGASMNNTGDDVYFIDPYQSDPLPRTARLGYGISTGMNLLFETYPLNLADIAFTVDAEDILIENSPGSVTNKTVFQSGFGDINIGKHILQIRGDDKVISRAGFQLNLMETFFIRMGHFSSKNYDLQKTNGYEFRIKGLLKLIDLISKDKVTAYLADHFDLRYYAAKYFAGNRFETDIEGVAIVFNGFEF